MSELEARGPEDNDASLELFICGSADPWE